MRSILLLVNNRENWIFGPNVMGSMYTTKCNSIKIKLIKTYSYYKITDHKMIKLNATFNFANLEFGL